MTERASQRCEEAFLILAPTGRDATLTSELLTKARMLAVICHDDGELCRRVREEGALALLLAEEALTSRGVNALTELLASQPSWSDLPILLFTGTLTTPDRLLAMRTIEALGNVTLLERPLRPVTMLSAANSALRARKRQYLARDELRAQREQVRQRDQFLAMLGHELRNPLSAITMAIELEGEESSAQYRAIVSRQARHLRRLVDDLLDVARVTTGKVVLQRTPVDLSELVGRTLAGMNPLIGRHELSLRSQLPDEPLMVLADPVRVEQVLVNLLNNAVKYTPARGEIEVRLSAEPSSAEIRVCDDGVGIATEMLPRVFDLFAQAEGTLDRAQGGMGIGLTLAKSLVQLHGGTISVESAGIGRGSTFIVRLPRTELQKAQPRRPATGVRAKPSSRDVLIIEDNDDSRELLASILRRRGHQVFAAADGPAGVELALARHPNAILVDIGLPGLDGYGVARELRSALGDEPLLIAVTGYGQPQDKANALEAGFDAHLTKPLEMQRLDHLLERVDEREAALGAPSSTSTSAKAAPRKSSLIARKPEVD